MRRTAANPNPIPCAGNAVKREPNGAAPADGSGKANRLVLRSMPLDNAIDKAVLLSPVPIELSATQEAEPAETVGWEGWLGAQPARSLTPGIDALCMARADEVIE